jgi:hypothetical protein
MTWAGIKMMATGRGVAELIGEWVPIWVSFGVVYLLINKDAAALIQSTMDSVSAALGGPQNLNDALSRGADPMFKAMVSVVELPRTSEFSWTDWSGNAAAIVSLLYGMAARIVALFFLLIATVVMMAHVVMSQVSVALALAMAPLMVPFLMFRPLSFIFDGWLRFLLTACMLKITASFILMMVGGLLANLTTTAAAIAQEMQGAAAADKFATDLLMFGMLILFALMAALLMAQAPGMAHGLLSGSGAQGFGGLSSLARQGTGAGAFQGGTSGVAGGARNFGAWMRGRAHGNQQNAEKDLRYRPPAAQAAYARGYRSGQKTFAANSPAPAPTP